MGSSAPDTTTTRTEPWQAQQPYLREAYSQAGDAFFDNPVSNTPYEYDRVAGQSGATAGGQDYALGYAESIAPGQFDDTNAAWQRSLNASDVGNNQYLADAAAASVDPLYDNLQERLLPQIGSQAIQQGAYGGGRQGVLEAQALKGTQEAAANSLAGFYGNAYQNGVNTEGRAIGQAGQVQALGLQPGIIAGQVGQQRDRYNQQLIDSSMQRYSELQNLPWQNLQNYNANIQGNVGGVTTGPAQQTGPSRGSAALSGAAIGYQTTSSPYGAAAGAIGGYLLGG